MTQVALVVHPVKVADPPALIENVRKRCAHLGWPEPIVVETSVEDPGAGVTRQALKDGATLVIAAGGDGTVRAVAEAVVLEGRAGTPAVLGIVPEGTGNLLVRNLDLPAGLDEALDVAFNGRDRTIDVGQVDSGEIFAVMAGIGLDAAMVRDAPEALKKRVGWLAYLFGAARGLRNERLKVQIVVDDAAPLVRSARAVLVGNVGRLQGGVDLLPESAPASGELEIAVLAARGPIEWMAVLTGAALGRHPARRDRRLERLSGRRIAVRARSPQPREVDGDLLPERADLSVEVLPGALTVRVPADDHTKEED